MFLEDNLKCLDYKKLNVEHFMETFMWFNVCHDFQSSQQQASDFSSVVCAMALLRKSAGLLLTLQYSRIVPRQLLI